MLDEQIQILKQSNKAKQQSKCLTQTCYRGGRPSLKLKSCDVFSLAQPLSLLRNVWLHVVLFYFRRGREGQKSLSFQFEMDAAGRRYATNYKPRWNIKESSRTIERCRKSRIHVTQDQGDGYKALKLYLQKVNPKCTTFFQYPKKYSTAKDAVWF